jgi:hypothetical protein
MKHQARQDCFPASDTSSHDQHAFAGSRLGASRSPHCLRISSSLRNPAATPRIAIDLPRFSSMSAHAGRLQNKNQVLLPAFQGRFNAAPMRCVFTPAEFSVRKIKMRNSKDLSRQLCCSAE